MTNRKITDEFQLSTFKCITNVSKLYLATDIITKWLLYDYLYLQFYIVYSPTHESTEARNMNYGSCSFAV